MLRIAICDDDEREQKQLADVICTCDPGQTPECFEDREKFLLAASQKPPFDLAFLDIYMPDAQGLETARQLRVLSPETEIVFVTGSREHAVDAFSLHALHYLMKPVTTDQIEEVFRRLAERSDERRPQVTLTVGGNTHNILLEDICYVQSADHAKVIVLSSGRSIWVWQTMAELIPRLGNGFLKLNRGTYVNMAHIERLGNGVCLLKNGTRLEFSRREAATVRAAYDEYLFARLPGSPGMGKEELL